MVTVGELTTKTELPEVQEVAEAVKVLDPDVTNLSPEYEAAPLELVATLVPVKLVDGEDVIVIEVAG